MKTDIEIAQEAVALDIKEIAAAEGIEAEYVEQYGRDKAKINYNVLKNHPEKKDGKLILVTAITPTPAGEGKPPPPSDLRTACISWENPLRRRFESRLSVRYSA